MLDGRENSASGVKRPVQTAFNACEYSFYSNPQNCGHQNGGPYASPVGAAHLPEILMSAISYQIPSQAAIQSYHFTMAR